MISEIVDKVIPSSKLPKDYAGRWSEGSDVLVVRLVDCEGELGIHCQHSGFERPSDYPVLREYRDVNVKFFRDCYALAALYNKKELSEEELFLYLEGDKNIKKQ